MRKLNGNGWGAPAVERSALIVLLLFLALAMSPREAFGVPNGYPGVTLRDSTAGCGGCHAADSAVQVTVIGANSLAAGASGVYTVRARKASLANGAVMGFTLAAGDNPSPLSESNANTAANTTTREVFHYAAGGALNTTTNVVEGGVNYGTATYQFTFTMPGGAAAGSPHLIYSIATLGADTGAGAQTRWNQGATFTIYAPPAAPSTLSASNVGPAGASLSWSGGGPQYLVVYKTGATAPASATDGTGVDVGAATSTTLTGLSPSTQYSIRLYSKIAGQAIFSSTGPAVTFTTLATAATSTALVSSINPSLVGQTVTFTASVTSSGGTPTGSITFKDGTTAICSSVALAGGQAGCATASLAQGTRSITAEYGGAPGYSASTSSVLSQSVRVSLPRYVNAATGVNSGDCAAPAAPCKTITYAMTQAASGSPGDSISVAPGVYSVALGEVFPIPFKSGVELVATGTAAATVIDGVGDPIRSGIFIANGQAGGRLEGFTIANGIHQAGQFATAQGGALRIFSVGSNFTVTRNVFSGNEARGFPGLAGSSFGGGLALGGAIYASFSADVSITNNVFIGNVARGGNALSHGAALTGQESGGIGEGGGIYLDSVGGAVTNNTFRANSAIGGNGGTASNGTGRGGNARGGGAAGNSTLTIVNNIFAANSVAGGTGGTPGTATAGAAATGSGSSSNNLSFANTVGGGASTGDALGPFPVTQDPQFHFPPSNLRILGTSPAKAAGTATGAPARDHDGTTRPNPPAIGAFEPSSSVTFNLVLEGWQQVGPYVATPASGSGTAVYDIANKRLTLSLPYSGLTGAETGAHIHGPALRGANAGVLASLAGTNPKADVVTLTAQQETQLYAGELYVNIHSSTYPGGELRAQIDNAGATVTRVLTVSKAGPGAGSVTGTAEPGTVISCGSDCSETVPGGKVVTLTATPSLASVFTGWSGDCSGTSPCVVTMSAARNVTANFFAAVPRYVNAATGVDSGGCAAQQNPCKTITYAMGQASGGSPGDSVNVAPGTYNAALGEAFPITIKSGVQLQATGTAAGSIIDGTGAGQRVLQTATAANSSTLLQGFTITGGLHAPTPDGSLARGGGLLVDSGSPTIRKNLFLANEARGYTGEGATFVSGGEAYGGGIYVTAGTPTIVNNVLRGNIARGGVGKSNPGSSTPGSPGGNGRGGGIHVQGASGGAVNNNTFYGNAAIGGNGGFSLGAGGTGGSALYGGLHSTGCSVNNNLFAQNMALGGDGGAGSPTGGDGSASYGAMQYNSPPSDASNNLFHGNTVDGLPSTGDTIGTNSRCFLAGGCASVAFHAAPGNLRILPTSPASGTGTATGAPADDFDATPRANPPSIGAFEPSSFAPSISLGATTLAFGGQSMGTTSPALYVTLTNTGQTSLSVGGLSIDNSQFAQTNNCGSVGPGASCTINVTFSPSPAAGTLNSTVQVSGTLTIASNGAGSPHAVTLSGTAEKSLVTHYYRSILRRAPDAGGVPYWQGEAARVAGLGANVNETWFALAQGFYTSSEYLAFNRDDTGFVTDLYATFFSRAPDGAGLGYWTGLLTQGMPREVVLVSFMFSTEFANFTQAIFGNTAARAEVDTVVDFYRGLLSRLPDSGGFNYWVGQFRTAQCSGGPAVYAQVEGISNAYVNSPEYGNRGRNNAQFVGDMYNAFLRRGGDLAGVQYWIGELDSGARTRENVRQAFIREPEFNQRVVAVINQGCSM